MSLPPTRAATPARPATLGAQLERDRLEQRAVRLDRVVAALRARARAYDDDSVPSPLTRSLTDFQRELTRVRSRLAGASSRRLDAAAAATASPPASARPRAARPAARAGS